MPPIAVVTALRTTGLPLVPPPSGNVQLSVAPLVAVALNVRFWPEHIGLGLAEIPVGAGMVFMTTATAVAGDAQPLIDCVAK